MMTELSKTLNIIYKVGNKNVRSDEIGKKQVTPNRYTFIFPLRFIYFHD